MNDAFEIAENLAVDLTGHIDQDVACIKCGYNLRGLDPNQVCPECATPVGRSTRGDLLQFSDPDWVEKLARGMHWIYMGIVVAILLGIFGAVFAGLSAGGGRPLGGQGLTILKTVLAFVPGVIGVVGLWLVTEPEPRRVFSEPSVNARSITRAAAVASFGVSLANTLLGQTGAIVVAIVALVGAVTGIVETVAKLTYARQLAFRIPDEKLARNTRIVMWGLLLILAFSVVTLLGVAVTPATTGTAKPKAVGFAAVGCVVAPVALFFGLWGLRLIDQFRKAMRTAAKLARETWSRSAPQSV